MSSIESRPEGRTRRHGDNPQGFYESYDLARARVGDALTLMTVDQERGKTEVFDLIKQETSPGASAVEGWTLETEMGRVTVRLLLSRRTAKGAAVPDYHRVVLREGYGLDVSARVAERLGSEDVLDKGAAVSTIRSMGVIAAMTDRLRVADDARELIS